MLSHQGTVKWDRFLLGVFSIKYSQHSRDFFTRSARCKKLLKNLERICNDHFIKIFADTFSVLNIKPSLSQL